LQPSALIGRGAELNAIAARLGDPHVRWLTLTGPPGVGKSRLAAAAAERAGEFTDGVFFVDLTPLTNAHEVMARVASTLGAAEPSGLVTRLGDRCTLLVVDTLEHVGSAAAELAFLLCECPHLKVLATSRIPLQVSWEHILRINPLPLPDNDDLSNPEGLCRVASVALFLARAAAATGALPPNAADLPVIAQICASLDGLPLAIELAAARLRTLSPGALLERLVENRLDVPNHAPRDKHQRHASMRAAIDWSYRQLSLNAQALFRTLSVFEDACSLTAIAAVSGSDSCDDTAIAALVDNSLVCVVHDGSQLRYRLLETLRAFGAERLRESGECSSVQQRHAAFFRALVEQLEPGLKDSRRAQTVDVFEGEYANISAALRWLLASERPGGDDALHLVTALSRFWLTTGRCAEGSDWLERTLAERQAEPSRALARALLASGDFALWRGDTSAARGYYGEAHTQSLQLADAHTEALALARQGNLARNRGELATARRLLSDAHRLFAELGDTRQLTFVLCDLSGVACDEGTFVEAVHRANHALVRFRTIDDADGIATALTRLGEAAYASFDLAQALALFEEGLRLRRELADVHQVADVLRRVASTAAAAGDRPRSTEALREALVLFQGIENTLGTVLVLGLCGESAIAASDARVGVRLCSAAAAHLLRLECVTPPHDRAWSDRALSLGRSRLGRRTFDMEWTLGQAMALKAAVELAHTLVAETTASGKLTGREHEVSALIAAGLSNRQVADDLAISERTVEVHVSNALRKLGLESRTQLALWAKSVQSPAVGVAVSGPARRSGGHSPRSPRARGRPAQSASSQNTAG
jgi:non-specific serine/threonine protein kinase